MSVPTVTLLVPDVGSPSVGAAIRMAGLIESSFPVEIVGPDMGTGVCPLYRDAYPITAVDCPRLYRYPDFWWERARLARAVRGQVVIALKAYMNTVPLALAIRRHRGVRVAVYLDEWDGSVLQDLTAGQRIRRRLAQMHHPLEDSFYPRVERMIPEADAVFSSTTFLQRKFGGHVIPMGVDTDFFKPQARGDVEALKQRMGLTACRLIVFGGVVRPHKGVELILEALELLGDRGVKLLVAGPVTEHLAALQKDPRWHPWLAVAGAAPPDREGLNATVHRQMPLYLDLADLIVLPLNNTPLAQSQMPIKLFEAMAMGKPIIGSEVADLPLMLEGCGTLVPPENARALSAKIGELLAKPEKARALGAAVRLRCVELYSREVVSRRINLLLKGLTE